MSAISEVKQRIDIVEVVSEYVTLQKAGRNFKGLCPFHSEKHSSFFVFPEQQTWHCFGACGIGGDVFSFLMKKEEIDFGEALRRLAQRAGVTLSSAEAPAKAEDEKKEKLFQINEAAAAYYHHLLLATKAGEAARSYLDKRKVTPETIKEFRLGFSPDGWEALKKYLMSKGYEEKELVEAGLTIERENGSSYDRFRNRLMFPICDTQGRVIGFGARALDDSLPKYINSPQTSIFDKSSSLYGIDKAISHIRKKNLVIIVEGYMDVLLPHQHGWQNVVASMGTSMTEKQIGIIKRLTKNISLALDADTAGEEATLRGVEVLAPFLDKAEVKVVALPQGKDPDEVVKENPALWQNLVEQALSILDFAFEAVISKVDINKAKDKSLAAQKLLPLISGIKDPIWQTHYVQKLARLLKLNEPDLVASMRKLQTNKRRYQSPETIKQSRSAHPLASSSVEEYCLALLLQYPELRQAAQELTPNHFEGTENQEIFIRWQLSPDTSTLEKELDANLLEHLNYLLNTPIITERNDKAPELDLSNCILRLQENLLRNLEAKKQVLLDIERGNGGVNAELAKLEEEGINSSQRLKEILIKKTRGFK